MFLQKNRQRQVLFAILVCSFVFVLLIYQTKGKIEWIKTEQKCARQESKDGNIILELIAESQRSNLTLHPVEKKCPLYREFRHLDFLHPALRQKLCHNAEAYKMYIDGFPMCKLPHPFDENLLNVVRQGTQMKTMDCINNTSVLISIYKERDYISDFIRKFNAWEPDMSNVTLKFALKVPQVTFLDIGSNIGVYSIQAAKLGLPVVSLDANIRNLLRLRLTLNAASLNADLVWNFISADQQLKYLSFLAECNIGGAGRDKYNMPDTIPVMPLKSERISSLIKTKNVVIKMDIQGGEAEFVKLSGRLFTDFNVAAIQMEWCTSFMREHEAKILMTFFASKGYKVWQIPNMKSLDENNSKSWPACIDIIWIHKDFVKLV